jgi:hypothetical protein
MIEKIKIYNLLLKEIKKDIDSKDYHLNIILTPKQYDLFN